jgi:hypothetical protein
MNTNERPETAGTMKGKSIMRNLRFYSMMSMALAVESPRWRRIFCSLFLITAVVAAVGAVSARTDGFAAVTTRRLPKPSLLAAQKIAPWVMEHTVKGQQAEFLLGCSRNFIA